MELLIIIIVAICIVNYLKNKKLKNENEIEYCQNNYERAIKRDIDYSVYKKKYLFTKTEYDFFFKLKNKTEEYNWIIFPKVRMEDFINVYAENYKMKQKYRGYIKSRHVDFLICDSKLNIIAAIELDDRTHNKKNRKEIDERKNNIYHAIGIPIFRIPVIQKNYDLEIENMIWDLLHG